MGNSKSLLPNKKANFILLCSFVACWLIRHRSVRQTEMTVGGIAQPHSDRPSSTSGPTHDGACSRAHTLTHFFPHSGQIFILQKVFKKKWHTMFSSFRHRVVFCAPAGFRNARPEFARKRKAREFASSRPAKCDKLSVVGKPIARSQTPNLAMDVYTSCYWTNKWRKSSIISSDFTNLIGWVHEWNG